MLYIRYCDEDILDDYNNKLGGSDKEKIRKICDSLSGKDKTIFTRFNESFY